MVRVWWPRFIRKPKLRLTKPSLKMPERPSSSFLFNLTLIFVLVIFGGGIWDLVFRERLLPMGTTSTNQPLLIYPSLDSQFLVEGIVASIAFLIGFVGVIIMYQSTRHVYRPSYARLLLFAGIAMVLLSYILMVIMLAGKFSTS